MNLKELKLKYTNRAVMVFEAITDKAFALNCVTDQYIFFYSVLIANNQDLDLTFDQFIDELDADPEALPHFLKWFTKEMQIQDKTNPQKKNPKANQ